MAAAWVGLLMGGFSDPLAAAEADMGDFRDLQDEYASTIHPMVKQYCLDCHSTFAQEGELDLEQYATFADVRKNPMVWQKAREMLVSGEMPPKDAAAQPSEKQRKRLEAWIEAYLHAEALANAGDPGPVLLRRLNNAEYTYTIRDLTHAGLNPAREFPSDGAAGEGFTNTGNSLVMSSPLLAKYVDAGKEIASHAVPLPEGFRFSESATRADWAREALGSIRTFYEKYTGGEEGTNVNLQGVQFKTNSGGRLQVAPYLAVTLTEREALENGTRTLEEVAQSHGVNSKYLKILWDALHDPEASLLVARLQNLWRKAAPEDAADLANEIDVWQDSLFRFSSVGHIGKKGGPQAWQEPVTPLATRQEIRMPLPLAPERQEVILYLVAGDAGDGNDHDFAVWERPRIVAAGRPDLLLRDIRRRWVHLKSRRERLVQSTVPALAAAAVAAQATQPIDVAKLAEQYQVDPAWVGGWLDYLSINPDAPLKLDHFTSKLTSAGGYDFVQGWGVAETPNVYANQSGNHVRIPGNLKPHGVVVHPSPEQNVAVGWRSPITGTVRVEAQITHAHPECGNGVTWSLERRRGANRQSLASGVAHGGSPNTVGPIESLSVQPGDLVSILIGPRDSNHACDLTDVEFTLTSQGNRSRRWNLSEDVSSDLTSANPHADSLNNDGVWHFYREPVAAGGDAAVIPAGSLMANWQLAASAEQQRKLAEAIQALLTDGPPGDANHPDAVLYRQLTSFQGPFAFEGGAETEVASPEDEDESDFGLAPAQFGQGPDGSKIDSASLSVKAPSVIEVRLPAELVAGTEFVTSGTLHDQGQAEGSVQFQVLTTRPDTASGIIPTPSTEAREPGSWTSDTRRTIPATPIVVGPDGPARERLEEAFADFRGLFPEALCYSEIVPVDEVVTLTLYYREDEALQRLMLDEAQQEELDRLWSELHFVSHDALTLVDAFEQLLEYASQDGDPSVFEPLRQPILNRAAEFRQSLLEAEPKQLDALLDFASRAYRRPLTDDQRQGYLTLYAELRQEGLSHDEAFRFLLTRIFVSPSFLYRLEKASEGAEASEISDWELATRLSYFLWSSLPDEELRAVAASGQLRKPDVLKGQARRMLDSPKIQRLATEFACQWLQIYEFHLSDEKSDTVFPEFVELREDMHQEAILFFTDLFRRDASVLEIFNANHAFVNQRLANFYGIPRGDEVAVDTWQRVEDVHAYGRGGIFGLGATLAKHSGASRSSPILRGIWVSETLLGEKLPNPPPGIPPLPGDGTSAEGLTVRQLTEMHTKDPACANCHKRVDPLGFALEKYDAIGRFRQQDRVGNPLDTSATLVDGTQFDGADGLRNYLLSDRREAVLRQFCKKLLGYSLGRSVRISDEPLLTTMQQNLAENDYRFSTAVETILASRQFREIRGREFGDADLP